MRNGGTSGAAYRRQPAHVCVFGSLGGHEAEETSDRTGGGVHPLHDVVRRILVQQQEIRWAVVLDYGGQFTGHFRGRSDLADEIIMRLHQRDSGDQVGARAGAEPDHLVRVEAIGPGVCPDPADGCRHVLERGREECLSAEPVADGGYGDAGLQQEAPGSHSSRAGKKPPPCP